MVSTLSLWFSSVSTVLVPTWVWNRPKFCTWVRNKLEKNRQSTERSRLKFTQNIASRLTVTLNSLILTFIIFAGVAITVWFILRVTSQADFTFFCGVFGFWLLFRVVREYNIPDLLVQRWNWCGISFFRTTARIFSWKNSFVPYTKSSKLLTSSGIIVSVLIFDFESAICCLNSVSFCSTIAAVLDLSILHLSASGDHKTLVHAKSHRES